MVAPFRDRAQFGTAVRVGSGSQEPGLPEASSSGTFRDSGMEGDLPTWPGTSQHEVRIRREHTGGKQHLVDASRKSKRSSQCARGASHNEERMPGAMLGWLVAFQSLPLALWVWIAWRGPATSVPGMHPVWW